MEAACLYRVAQESLHNVLKHARAGYVQMSVSGDSKGIHLSIHETGVGFDSEGRGPAPPSGPPAGVIIMIAARRGKAFGHGFRGLDSLWSLLLTALRGIATKVRRAQFPEVNCEP